MNLSLETVSCVEFLVPFFKSSRELKIPCISNYIGTVKVRLIYRSTRKSPQYCKY